MRVFSLRAPLVGRQPRQLQRALDGFRAAVAEKHAVHARPGGQLARQRPLVRVMVEIGDVDYAGRLTPHDAHQARMRVTQRVDREAAQKIQILLPARIVQIAALPAREHHRRPLVGGHQIPLGVAQRG